MWVKKRKIKHKLELVSLHIPKTAGTSFRNILKTAYGAERVVRFDIHDEGKRIMIENEAFKKNRIPGHIHVIHGHFAYQHLAKRIEIADDLPIITWLRNPVERVISNYFYLSKRLSDELDEQGKGLNILAKMQKTLLEYARSDMNRNRMSRFLEGIDLADFKFVGIHEYFNEDLVYFGELFGIKNIQAFQQNVTIGKHQVADDIIGEITELNALDVALYKKGLDLRQQRINSQLS